MVCRLFNSPSALPAFISINRMGKVTADRAASNEVIADPSVVSPPLPPLSFLAGFSKTFSPHSTPARHVPRFLVCPPASVSICLFLPVCLSLLICQSVCRYAFLALFPLRLWGSRICPTTDCACRKRRQHFGIDHLRKARECSNLLPTAPRGGVPRMQKLRVPVLGSWGYPRIPFCLASSRSECSFTCCACLQGFYWPSFRICLPGSFNIIFLKFLQSSTVECVLS